MVRWTPPVAFVVYNTLSRGDSGLLFCWRPDDAPSVTGPLMLSLKQNVPWLGPILFDGWLQCRFQHRSDIRGVAEAARAATMDDKALYEPLLQHCLLFIQEPRFLPVQSEQCRALMIALLRHAGSFMEEWTLDAWDTYHQDDGIMIALLKDLCAAGDGARAARLAEHAAERVLRSNKSADAAWFAEKVLAHFPGQFPETPCICACVAATATSRKN